jgi:predicted kinase
MDLYVRAGRAAANRVLSRYIARTGDTGLIVGLPVFLSSRALIRAHVAARSGNPGLAPGYLERALDYLTPRPGLVIAVGGLPGSGKSTLARAIAAGIGRPPGALVVRSDEIRKRLAGVAPEQRLAPATYTPAASEAVFAELGRMVTEAARGGQAVIADATFMNRAHRAIVADAARSAGVPFVGLWLSAPLEELERRVVERTADASDAGLEVLRAAAHADPGAGDWVAIDSGDPEAAKTLAIGTLAAYL